MSQNLGVRAAGVEEGVAEDGESRGVQCPAREKAGVAGSLA